MGPLIVVAAKAANTAKKKKKKRKKSEQRSRGELQRGREFVRAHLSVVW